MSLDAHRSRAPRHLTVGVVTLSDTRRPETDASGPAIRAAFEAAGHAVRGPHILREDPLTLPAALVGPR